MPITDIDDLDRVRSITLRYVEIANSCDIALTDQQRRWLQLDLIAAATKIDIDFQAMLDGRDQDLAHDVAGIMRHLDRETGELRDGFTPRFAVNQ